MPLTSLYLNNLCCFCIIDHILLLVILYSWAFRVQVEFKPPYNVVNTMEYESLTCLRRNDCCRQMLSANSEKITKRKYNNLPRLCRICLSGGMKQLWSVIKDSSQAAHTAAILTPAMRKMSPEHYIARAHTHIPFTDTLSYHCQSQ